MRDGGVKSIRRNVFNWEFFPTRNAIIYDRLRNIETFFKRCILSTELLKKKIFKNPSSFYYCVILTDLTVLLYKDVCDIYTAVQVTAA